jgi:hypothetical protein
MAICQQHMLCHDRMHALAVRFYHVSVTTVTDTDLAGLSFDNEFGHVCKRRAGRTDSRQRYPAINRDPPAPWRVTLVWPWP